MTRGMLRLVGSVLILYGIAGVVLLGAIGWNIARPLDDIREMAGSVTDQRDAALDALDRATETIDQTAAGVRGMEGSLLEAHGATQRAAGLSRGVALSMYTLRDQMQLTIFGVQPLIGLAPGFEQSGVQLDLLAEDVDAISVALDANREDALAVAAGLDELGLSMGRLREAVASGPDVTEMVDELEPIQLALLALIGWLLLAAVGCILGGLLCWRASRVAQRGSIEPTA